MSVDLIVWPRWWSVRLSMVADLGMDAVRQLVELGRLAGPGRYWFHGYDLEVEPEPPRSRHRRCRPNRRYRKGRRS